MPTPETLERFIASVEANTHLQAVEDFYAPDVVVQENQSPPRVGREVQIDRERAVKARAMSMQSRCIRPVFVNGDHVAIRWVFRFDWADGTVTEMEEMAVQEWRDEQIVREAFFYDPAQRVPLRPGQAKA